MTLTSGSDSESSAPKLYFHLKTDLQDASHNSSSTDMQRNI